MTRQQWMAALAAVILATGVTYADGPNTLSAALTGDQEVPAVSTPGHGTVALEIDDDGEAVDYELTYEGLQGDVLQAHIHLAQASVNGGVMVWMCKTTQAAPAGTPDCPGPRSGSVRGTWTSDSVVGPSGQGVSAGEFAEFVAAVRKEIAYANVHSTTQPGGEIRGQLRAGGGHR